MSSTTLPGTIIAPPSGRGHILLGVVSLVLACVTLAWFWQDLSLRRQAADLLRSSGLGARHELVGTLNVLESGDLAEAFATQAALAELAPGLQASGASAQHGSSARAALASARDLAADAVSARPGWAHHRLLLGQAGYALWDLDARPTAAATNAWQKAFEVAGQGAPGFDLISASAADASLAAWPRLPVADRENATATLRRAFLSPEYVRRTFPDAWRLLGSRAGTLLPESPDQIAEAAAALRGIGETAGAEELERRRQRLGTVSER